MTQSNGSVPSLAEFHISETCGFLLEDPLEELPDYFQEWEKIGKNVSQLLEARQLRQEVDQMSLLDHSRLEGHRQKRLAYMLLVFMSNGYIWQEGEDGIPQRVPRSLAIPLCALANDLEMQPAVCHAASCLSNWQLIDKQGPLCVDNMHAICFFPGGRHFEWFCIATAQVELEALPGLQGIVQAMTAVSKQNSEDVLRGLVKVAASIKMMEQATKRLYERLGANEFFDSIRPYLAGWGGPASKAPDGILFEGVSETPIQVTGASAAQSTTLQCFDAFLGIQHDLEKQQFLKKMLGYMPGDHANFVRAIRQGPSVRDFVIESGSTELVAAYDACAMAVVDFRSTHLQLVTKYIVIPSGRQTRQKDYEGISKKGTGGQDLMPFLKGLRSTTQDAKLDQ